MKCDEFERWLLLEATGELTSAQAARLRDHLATCSACRAWQADLARLHHLVSSVPAPEPSPAVVARLLTAVRTARPPVRLVLRPWFGPALAAAALAVVLLGGIALVTGIRRGAPGPQAAGTRLPEISSLVAMLLPEESVGEAAPSPEAVNVRELARHLLIMEGLAVELPNGEEAELTPL